MHTRVPRTITLGIFVLVGGLVLWVIWVNASFASREKYELLNTARDGQLSAEKTKYNFGTISMAQGVVRHDFVIMNSGRTALTLNKLFTTCACIGATILRQNRAIGPSHAPRREARDLNEIILPGESAMVSVTFDPEAHGPAGIGKIIRKIGVEYGAPQPLTLRVSAFVTP